MVKRRTTVAFLCEVCHTEYDTKEEAMQCEQMLIEDETFKVGEQVQSRRERFTCSNGCESFAPVSIITGMFLTGNDSFAQDYVNRCLHGTSAQTLLGNMHLRRYEVNYECPNCEKSSNSLFFSVELEPS